MPFGALPGPLVVLLLLARAMHWLHRDPLGSDFPTPDRGPGTSRQCKGVQQFEEPLGSLECVVVVAATYHVQSIGVASISWEAVTTSLIEVLGSTAG